MQIEHVEGPATCSPAAALDLPVAPSAGDLAAATARGHLGAPRRREDWSDPELVDACLAGDDGAWAALIGRYKQAIYGLPRTYGAGPADAADIFQLVCAELFVALPRLRNHASVRSWIMTVTAHESYRWKRRQLRASTCDAEAVDEAADVITVPASVAIERAEREQIVREAVGKLAPRDRELVRLLFYEDPPVPYHDVAGRLGLARGSVPFIRARCLKRLVRILEDAGLAY